MGWFHTFTYFSSLSALVANKGAHPLLSALIANQHRPSCARTSGTDGLCSFAIRADRLHSSALPFTQLPTLLIMKIVFCLVWGFWEPYEAFEFFKIGFLASLLEFSACLARNSGRCHLTRKSPILQPSNFKCFLQIPGSPRPKINPIYAVSRSSLIGRWLNPKINFLKQCGIKWHNLLFTLPTAVNQDYWR